MHFKTLRDEAKRGSEITAQLTKEKIAKTVQNDEGRLRIDIRDSISEKKEITLEASLLLKVRIRSVEACCPGSVNVI